MCIISLYYQKKIQWVTLFWTTVKVMPNFQMTLNLLLGLILTPEFSIILSLTLIAASDAECHETYDQTSASCSS